jgi:hypothetical protein
VQQVPQEEDRAGSDGQLDREQRDRSGDGDQPAFRGAWAPKQPSSAGLERYGPDPLGPLPATTTRDNLRKPSARQRSNCANSGARQTCADQLVATLALASSAIAMTFRRGRSEDGGVSTQNLVVRPGDRVSASGRYVLCDDGEWLDLARVDGLVIHRAGSRSSHSVRLIGLDPAGVPRDFGSDDIIPGYVRVTGIWQDEPR